MENYKGHMYLKSISPRVKCVIIYFMILFFGMTLFETDFLNDNLLNRYSFYAVMLIFGISVVIYFRNEINMRSFWLQMALVAAVIMSVLIMMNFGVI